MRKIRLTESQLNRVILNTAKRLVKEAQNLDDYPWGQEIPEDGEEPRRAPRPTETGGWGGWRPSKSKFPEDGEEPPYGRDEEWTGEEEPEPFPYRRRGEEDGEWEDEPTTKSSIRSKWAGPHKKPDTMFDESRASRRRLKEGYSKKKFRRF